MFELDRSLTLFINRDLENQLFNVFFPWVTDLHKNDFVMALVLLILLALVFRTGFKRGFLFLGFVLLALGFSDLMGGQFLKPTFARLRPDIQGLDVILRSPHFGGYSFPSNHAMNMFVLAGYTLRLNSKLFLIALILAFLVAFSRVYNGVHFVGDVVGGAIVGFLVGLLFFWLARQVLRYVFTK